MLTTNQPNNGTQQRAERSAEFNALASALDKLVPTLTETEQRVSLALYKALARGKAVDPSEFADPKSREIIDGWPATNRDQTGKIIGHWGLTIRPTQHRIEIGDRALWTWCAWDTLFLPELLGCELRVVSTCPQTNDTVEMRLAPDRVLSVKPESTVLSFVDPIMADPKNIISSFCHQVFFFKDPDAGQQWAANRTGVVVLRLDEGLELGRIANRIRYPAHRQA